MWMEKEKRKGNKTIGQGEVEVLKLRKKCEEVDGEWQMSIIKRGPMAVVAMSILTVTNDVESELGG